MTHSRADIYLHKPTTTIKTAWKYSNVIWNWSYVTGFSKGLKKGKKGYAKRKILIIYIYIYTSIYIYIYIWNADQLRICFVIPKITDDLTWESYTFFNPLTKGGGGGAVRPPSLGFLPFTQNIFRQPIPEDFFVADATMKNKSKNWSYPLSEYFEIWVWKSPIG